MFTTMDIFFQVGTDFKISKYGSTKVPKSLNYEGKYYRPEGNLGVVVQQ